MNGFNIAAQSIFINAIGKSVAGQAFIGTVKELSTGTFGFQPQNASATLQTVNISAGTVFTRGGLPAAITELSGGQTVVVTGEEDPSNPELINANKVEIVISSEPGKQIANKGTVVTATAKTSFFGGIFKAISNFFAKIFSWL